MQSIDDIIEMLDRGVDTSIVIQSLNTFRDNIHLAISKSQSVISDTIPNGSIDQEDINQEDINQEDDPKEDLSGVTSVEDSDNTITKMIQYLFRGWMLTQIIDGIEATHVCPLCAKPINE